MASIVITAAEVFGTTDAERAVASIVRIGGGQYRVATASTKTDCVDYPTAVAEATKAVDAVESAVVTADPVVQGIITSLGAKADTLEAEKATLVARVAVLEAQIAAQAATARVVA